MRLVATRCRLQARNDNEQSEDDQDAHTRWFARQKAGMDAAPVADRENKNDQCETQPPPVRGNSLADNRQAYLKRM